VLREFLHFRIRVVIQAMNRPPLQNVHDAPRIESRRGKLVSASGGSLVDALRQQSTRAAEGRATTAARRLRRDRFGNAPSSIRSATSRCNAIAASGGVTSRISMPSASARPLAAITGHTLHCQPLLSLVASIW
jgi:hypothetical protein